MAVLAWIVGLGIAWAVCSLVVAVAVGGAITRTRPQLPAELPRRSRADRRSAPALRCARTDRPAGRGRG